jgi:hypothetical protein
MSFPQWAAGVSAIQCHITRHSPKVRVMRGGYSLPWPAAPALAGNRQPFDRLPLTGLTRSPAASLFLQEINSHSSALRPPALSRHEQGSYDVIPAILPAAERVARESDGSVRNPPETDIRAVALLTVRKNVGFVLKSRSLTRRSFCLARPFCPTGR